MIWGLGGAVPRPRRDGAPRAEEALSSRGFACGAGTGGGDGAESPYEAAAGRVSGSDGSTQGREGIGAVRRSERGELHEGGGRVAEHPHGAGGLSAVICFSDSGGGAARRGARGGGRRECVRGRGRVEDAGIARGFAGLLRDACSEVGATGMRRMRRRRTDPRLFRFEIDMRNDGVLIWRFTGHLGSAGEGTSPFARPEGGAAHIECFTTRDPERIPPLFFLRPSRPEANLSPSLFPSRAAVLPSASRLASGTDPTPPHAFPEPPPVDSPPSRRGKYGGSP